MPTFPAEPHASDPASEPPPGPPAAANLVVVGGVPGAGKSTVIASVAQAPGVASLDPDRLRAPVAARYPAVPYRAYRWAVHTVHTVVAWAVVLVGPGILRHWPGWSTRWLSTGTGRAGRTCGRRSSRGSSTGWSSPGRPVWSRAASP